MFCTVLHTLKSPQNVGMIVRSHLAYEGACVVMVGHDQPWRFGKGTQAFSRKLESRCRIVHLKSDDEFFAWCEAENWTPVALEVAAPPIYLEEFTFPRRTALIVGNEGTGLSREFLDRCRWVVTAPQFGPVGSMNVAVACSIAIYELNRGRLPKREIEGTKFVGEHVAGPDRRSV